MVKSFLIVLSLQIFLFSSDQIILVLSEDENSSKAKLQCFEDHKPVFGAVDVNLGKNGLGFGLGKTRLIQTDKVLKYEGDKRAPIGIFKLTHIFGYDKSANYSMPYLHANKDLICVDDSDHKSYNQIISMSSLPKKDLPKSFEYMKRDDEQYKLGIIVEHNKDQIKKRGSCIFMHIEKHPDAPTAGCTSMKYKDIKRIAEWLDIKKDPILIQIPRSRLGEIYKLYPKLKQ